MKGIIRNLQILVVTVILCLTVGISAAYASGLKDSGSSSDWEVSLSNIDWGQISFSIDGPEADWDHPIIKHIIPGVKLGVTMKIGGSGDFDVNIKQANLKDTVNVNTHIIRTASDIWLSGKEMYLKKFTPDNILDYLRYVPGISGSVEGYFAAAATAPVKVKGHFNNMTTISFSTTTGVTKKDDRTMKLTSVEPVDANKEVVFFVGSDFLETASALHVDLKVVTIGPVFEVDVDVLAGANGVAKLEKDKYKLTVASADSEGVGQTTTYVKERDDRTGEYGEVSGDWIHSCLIKWDSGCVSGTENDIADQHATVGIHMKGSFLSWDFNIFSHDWDVYDSYDLTHGNRQFVQSLTYGDGLKYQSSCDHKYYKVPVTVKQGETGGTETTVSGASVNTMASFKHSNDVGIGRGTTGTDGTTTLYLPSQNMTIAAHKKIGENTHSGSKAVIASDIAKNTPVEIILSAESDETKTVKVQKEWEVDLDGFDKPEQILAVIEKWDHLNSKWDIYEHHDTSGYSLAVVTLNESNHWSYEYDGLPKSENTKGEELGNIYRVRELAEGAQYDKAAYSTADKAKRTEIRNALREHIVHDEFDYLNEPDTAVTSSNSVEYSINAYTSRTGEFVPDHITKYDVSYGLRFYDKEKDSTSPESEVDDELWTITNTAVYDAVINKRFIVPEGTLLPQNVYLALMARPRTGWSDVALDRGVAWTEQIVTDPRSGGMMLGELSDEGVVNLSTVPGFEMLDLAVGRASSPNNYTVRFTVDKYKKGIPLDFSCSELTSELLRWMFLQVFDVSITPTVYTENPFLMIPGGAYPLPDDATLLVGTVINVQTKDPLHTIGGTKYWVNTGASDLSQIEYIKLHIKRSDTGEEIAGSPVTVYAKDNMITNADGSSQVRTAWVWTVTDTSIDSTKNYIVTEETFPDSYENSDSWIPQFRERDIINTWAGSEKKVKFWKFFDPAVTVHSGESITFTLKTADGTTTVCEASNTFTGSDTIKQSSTEEYTLSGTWKEIMGYHLRETVNISGHTFVPSYSDPVVTLKKDGKPVVVFAVTNRQQKNYAFEIQKTWDPESSAPTGTDSSVVVKVYQNNSTLHGTYNLSKSGSWKYDESDTTKYLPYLDTDGVPYVYTLMESALSGFTSSWTRSVDDTNNKISFVLTNKQQTAGDYVTLTVTKNWVEKNNVTTYRPEKVTFSVVGIDSMGDYHYMGSEEILKDIDVTEQSVTFEGLPKMDEYGWNYRYTVLEGHVPSYTTTYVSNQDASGNWTCTVTNTLTSGCEVIIQKTLTNVPENAGTKTFSFNVTPKSAPEGKTAPYPIEWGTSIQITGEGELALHFPIELAGTYVYTISETDASTDDLSYDTTARKLIIVAENDSSNHLTYKTYVKLVRSDTTVDEDVDFTHFTETGTIVFNNIYNNLIEISAQKTWDIDLEQKDKPDSIQVVLESLSYNQVKEYYDASDSSTTMTWKTVGGPIKLDAANNWSDKFPNKVPANDVDAEGNLHEIRYRVRELKEDTTGGQSVSDWIVHSKDDIDKVTVADLKSIGVSNAENAYRYELTENGRDSFNKDHLYTEDDQTVEYTVPEYQTINGETEPEHKTKYDVKYEMEDNKASITNTAILDTNIYKRWINFKEDEKPDSVYLTLTGRVREEYREMVPPELQNLAGTYIPVINPLTNGMTLADIVGISIPDGLDGGITSLSLAIAKATDDKDDPLKAWHVGFKIKKYSLFGLPMEYEGAELSSAILKSLIKALTGIDFPISFSLTGGYVSIPGKAYCIPVLDKDWQLTSNVFNVKIHIDPDQTPTPTPKPTPTPTSKPPVPPIPPVPTASPGPPVPTVKPPDPPTPTPKETPTPGPKTRTIAGIKYWINDSATTRPDTLTVHIYNGVEEIQGSPVTLKKSTYGDSIVWPFALQTTDEGPDSNYTVAEEFPQGYENWEKYRRVSSGLYLYNYWFGDKTPIIRIRKVWKGGTPAGAKATVALRKTGSQTDLTTFELNEGNEYKAEIWMNDEDLKGLDISQITVYEKDLSGGNYKPTYTGPILSYDGDTPVYTFTVTNWPVENVRVIVEKNWIGDDETTRPQSLDVQIVRTAPDGTEMRIPFGLTKDTWKRTSTSDEEKQMPNLDEDGRQYRYSIEEESVSGYRTSVQSNRNGNTITFTLNNTWIPEEDLVNVSGFKVWEDDDDAFGLRPETIRVVVMNSRAERVSEIMELPADSAEWNVQGLPRYDEDGNKLKYYVVEEQPESYTVSYSVPFFDELNNTWVCNVYNTYSARKKVIVEKKWIPEAGIPSSLAVYLYAGDNLRASIFLNEQNHWKHVFSDLPVLDEEGNGIVYRVVEDIPDGYTGSSYLVREGLDEHFYLENRKLDAGKLAIPVEKIMTGGLIPDSEDEVFRFKLTGVEYVGISGSSDQVEKLPGDGDEITIRNEGTGAFIIPFVKEGLYFYTIQEIPGNNANITYDERSRPILIYAYRDEQTGPMQFEWGVIESSVPVVRRYVTFTNTSKQRLYTITYDPNGGIIEGDTKPVSNRYPYGKIISIHEAAVREGYLFDYWKGSVYNPGDHYTVVEDHLFIAQWISRYVNPFTFTKIWDGNPGGGLNFTVYNLDGTPTGIGFPAPTKLSENRWEYQRWFIEKPEYYVVEEAPAGYYATYSNVGEYADVTDRCYNGGTITNHQIPDTGDNANRALWAALALVSCGFLLIIFARGKRAEQRR